MTELRYNNQGGVLGGALTNVGTTITFAVAPNFATLTGGQTITLVIEPGTANMEITYLTAYTAGATTGTITRAAEDSSHWPAVAHNTAVVWQATPTVNDFNSLAPLASPTFTGTVTVANGAVLGTPASVTLTNGTGLPESGVTNLTSDLALKAPLASPTFTGTPAAPTAAVGTNTTQVASTAFVQAASYMPITTQAGTTYTLVLADAISEIEFTNAAAVTVTVPTNASVAFPVGTTINIRQMGAGQITVAAAGGVTVDTDSVFTTPEQYSTIGLIKSATNVWVLSGTAAIPASLPPNGAAGGDLSGTYPNPTVPGALKAASNLSDVAQRGSSRYNLRLPVIASCQAVATANVSISAPGASMDGYTFTTSGTDSFLLTGQNTASENGIWTWNGAASPATRQTDFPHGGSITGGRFVQVQNGSVNAGTLWTLAVASNAPITVDTTAQTWSQLVVTKGAFQALLTPQTVSGLTVNSTTSVTVNIPSTLGLAVGQFVTVASVVGPTNVNGTWAIASLVANTSVTLTTTAASGSYTSGGTVTPTFTPTTTGLYRIRVLGGGGGGGGGASGATSSLPGSGGAGGGAGGTADAYQTLVAATNYLCTIGAGGAGGTTSAGVHQQGGDGGNGNVSTFAGTSNVIGAPGGQAMGGQYSSTATTAVLSMNILKVTLANGLKFGNAGVPGLAVAGIESAAGGTYGSAGTTGTGINGAFMVCKISGTSSTTWEFIYGNGGIAPSGTYTSASAVVTPIFISNGVWGVPTYSIQGDEFGPGYGGPAVYVLGVGWVASDGFGPVGLAGGGGASGAASSATKGGVGGTAGSLAGGGVHVGNGTSGTTAGTDGGAAAAGTGAGGGGGGGACAANAGQGGAGGSGLIVIEGPL